MKMNRQRIITNKRNLTAALLGAPLAKVCEMTNIEAASINSSIKEKELKAQRIVSRIIIAALALFTFSISAWASPPDANSYGLGVSMGLASFQASRAQGEYPIIVRDELNQARKFAYLVKGNVKNLDVNQLEQMLESLRNTDDPRSTVQQIAAQLPSVRGSYSVTIRKSSVREGNAFDLGVDMAIAEGQATVGEDARGIVRSSLANAKGPAKSLGLNVSELDNIVAQIDQGVPIADVYNQIAYLRGKYQASL